jgi:hypothetical protein
MGLGQNPPRDHLITIPAGLNSNQVICSQQEIPADWQSNAASGSSAGSDYHDFPGGRFNKLAISSSKFS